LETELGITDLSLETQLKEIEQGLFDLLAQRPGAK
jgi:flagellar biosynthesis/type III secretory pathway protein FliH